MCLNHLQKNVPVMVELDEEWQIPGSPAHRTPEAQAVKAEWSEQVRAAILSLPAHYRAVIELRHYQELSYLEISEILEIPLSDVKSHLHRARRALAQRLAA